MKRVIVSLMVVVGALGSACTEEEESIPAAGLSGTYDVVLVRDPVRNEGRPAQGDLLFVTSTDRNELRVLDLKEEAAERGYLRAPNPLEALSVPVLERPQALTRDVRYDEGDGTSANPGTGVDVGGSYVYARSNGSTSISVVASDRTLLREVMQVVTNDPARFGSAMSAGPVTAFAARGPAREGDPSTLYYTTQETTGAWLWELEVPAPKNLLAGSKPVGPVRRLEGVLPANVAVSSLLVLPQGELAVATRSIAGSALGKTYKVNPLTNTLVTELNFGGQQVLQLATHPRVVGSPPSTGEPAPVLRREGERIFGILDPSSCGAGQTQCSSGVLAVASATGSVLNDVTGHPMLPIGLGSGLPMGLSLSANTFVSSVGNLPLLGIVPLSSGNILLFDAEELRLIDVDTFNFKTSDEDTQQDAEAQVSLLTTQGINRGDTGDVTVEVTYGVTRNATYQLTYQGILPGMASLDRGGATTVFLVPTEPIKGKGQPVQARDLLVLFPEQVGGQPCATDLVVDAVLPPLPEDPTKTPVTTTTPIPQDCLAYTRFLVRAGGSQPLVLSSSNEDYVQRLGLSENYSRTGSYFFHPDGYTGASEGVDVRITVSNRLATDIARGDRYVVNTFSHVFPYSLTVDINIQQLQFFLLPGPVVQAEVGGTDYAYIAYPSADGLLQVNLQLVFPEVANSRGVFPYQ